MVLEDERENTANISAFQAHFLNDFKLLSQLDMKTQTFNAYTKFLQVRHPFIRLISAFRDKISGEISFLKQEKQFLDIARSIVLKYREGADTDDLRPAKLRVTWEEWIRYLTDPSSRPKFNAHWREVYKLCLPCNIHYDFIGNLETVGADSKFFLDNLGFGNISYPLPHSHSDKSSSDLYSTYFVNVSRKDILTLYRIYKFDFELFGFEKPSILNF